MVAAVVVCIASETGNEVEANIGHARAIVDNTNDDMTILPSHEQAENKLNNPTKEKSPLKQKY